MENPLGFAHFLANSDGIARFILALMVIMSVGTWYLIVTKGIQSIRLQRLRQSSWPSPPSTTTATKRWPRST